VSTSRVAAPDQYTIDRGKKPDRPISSGEVSEEHGDRSRFARDALRGGYATAEGQQARMVHHRPPVAIRGNSLKQRKTAPVSWSRFGMID